MAQIKKDTSLRKAILQAAITGQLVSNVEGTTETGKQLLDRIIEERNKKLLAEWEEAVKKNPKAKKPALVVASEIDEDEIPFEIPENWYWCKIQDICLVKGGKRIPAGCTLTEVDTGHKYIRVADMKNGSVIINNVKYITDAIHEKIKAYKISKDDVYITVAGTIGDSGIIPDELDNANLTENADKLVLFNGINKYCLHYFLSSGFFQEQISDAITKVGQPKLAIIRIQNFILPLPPLEVQNAIVEKLEQVLPLVDVYENAVLQKEELKNALPNKVKKAILQEAITGKLTEAWRKTAKITETGKQLLDRIISERNAKALAEWEETLKKNPKLKKPAPIIASEIEEDEIPFEIPESWCWIRGKNIFAPMESTKPQGETFTYIDTDAVNNKLNIIDNPKNLLVKEAPSRASRKLHRGDVLFSMVRPYLKNIAFVEDCFADAIASTGFYVMTQIGMYNPKYLYYMVLSPYVIDGLHYFMKGDNSPSINTTDIDNFVYPLPPLEEQEAIVKKVEELLPLCK